MKALKILATSAFLGAMASTASATCMFNEKGQITGFYTSNKFAKMDNFIKRQVRRNPEHIGVVLSNNHGQVVHRGTKSTSTLSDRDLTRQCARSRNANRHLVQTIK